MLRDPRESASHHSAGKAVKGERERVPRSGIVRPLTAKGTRSRTINAHGQLSLPILKSKAVAFALSTECGDRCRRTETCALRDTCRAVRGFFRDARVPNRWRSGWRAAGAVRLTDDRNSTRCRSDRSRSEAPKADSEMARRVKRAAHQWQARCLPAAQRANETSGPTSAGWCASKGAGARSGRDGF